MTDRLLGVKVHSNAQENLKSSVKENSSLIRPIKDKSRISTTLLTL